MRCHAWVSAYYSSILSRNTIGNCCELPPRQHPTAGALKSLLPESPLGRVRTGDGGGSGLWGLRKVGTFLHCVYGGLQPHFSMAGRASSMYGLLRLFQRRLWQGGGVLQAPKAGTRLDSCICPGCLHSDQTIPGVHTMQITMRKAYT